MISRRCWLILALASLCLHVQACGTSDDAQQSSPTVALTERIVLRDSGGSRLSRPSSIAQSASGDYFIADRMLGRLVRFASDGTPLNTIGNKGSGPGEFEAPRTTVMLGDSIIVGIDPGLRRAQRFRINGDPVGEALDLPFDLSQPTSDGSGVWFGGANLADDFAVLHWNPAINLLTPLVPIPRQIREFPSLLLLGGAIPIVDSGVLLVGFGSGEVFIASPTTGQIVDTISVPSLHRRGVPETALSAARQGDGFGVLNSASSLAALTMLSDGGIALVFRDLTREAVGFRSAVYLTILDSSRRPVCIDLAVPQVDSAAPLIAFRGDTLLLLEQEMVGSDSVQSVVSRFAIPIPTSC